MRRVILYLAVVFMGFSCLAVTWHLEPPIQKMPRPRIKPPKSMAMKKDFHIRLFSRDKLELDELIVEIGWDETQIRKPTVKYGRVTRRARPRLKVVGNQAVIHFKNMRGQKAQIIGRGPIARMSFTQFDPDEKVGAKSVRVLSAKGVTPTGEEVDIAGITIARYTPRVKKPANTLNPAKGKAK